MSDKIGRSGTNTGYIMKDKLTLLVDAMLQFHTTIDYLS